MPDAAWRRSPAPGGAGVGTRLGDSPKDGRRRRGGIARRRRGCRGCRTDEPRAPAVPRLALASTSSSNSSSWPTSSIARSSRRVSVRSGVVAEIGGSASDRPAGPPGEVRTDVLRGRGRCRATEGRPLGNREPAARPRRGERRGSGGPAQRVATVRRAAGGFEAAAGGAGAGGEGGLRRRGGPPNPGSADRLLLQQTLALTHFTARQRRFLRRRHSTLR